MSLQGIQPNNCSCCLLIYPFSTSDTECVQWAHGRFSLPLPQSIPSSSWWRLHVWTPLKGSLSPQLGCMSPPGSQPPHSLCSHISCGLQNPDPSTTTTPQSRRHVSAAHLHGQAGSRTDVLAGGKTRWRLVYCRCLCVSHLLSFSFFLTKFLLSLSACLLKYSTDTGV